MLNWFYYTNIQRWYAALNKDRSTGVADVERRCIEFGVLKQTNYDKVRDNSQYWRVSLSDL
jgi:hypothetical protein